MPMVSTLHCLPFSHYCEKAIWALQRADYPFVVKMHRPGLHRRPVKQLSGQSAVPVLQTDRQVIIGSDKICSFAHHYAPQSGLIPADLADDVLAWQARFDDIAARLRGLLFRDILRDPKLATDILSAGAVAGRVTVFSLFFRSLCPLLRRMNEKTEPSEDQALMDCRQVMEDAAAVVAKRGTLVGDRVTLADIAAASLLSPLFCPPKALGADFAASHPGMEGWFARWAEHPIKPYVLRMYEEHRGVPLQHQGFVPRKV